MHRYLTSLRSTTLAAALLISSALALAACGSSTKTTSASAAPSGASTTTTASGTATGATGRSRLTSTQRSCLSSHGITLGAGGFGNHRFTHTGTSTTGAPPTGAGGFPGAGKRDHAGFGARFSKDAAAFKACGVSFGGGFGARRFGAAGFGAGGHGRLTKLSATTIKAFVTCVDQHGYTLTGVNTTGSGPVLPASLRTNAKFLAAAKSCTSLLRGGGGA